MRYVFIAINSNCLSSLTGKLNQQVMAYQITKERRLDKSLLSLYPSYDDTLTYTYCYTLAACSDASFCSVY